jgi:hypothetical protein
VLSSQDAAQPRSLKWHWIVWRHHWCPLCKPGAHKSSCPSHSHLPSPDATEPHELKDLSPVNRPHARRVSTTKLNQKDSEHLWRFKSAPKLFTRSKLNEELFPDMKRLRTNHMLTTNHTASFQRFSSYGWYRIHAHADC